MRAGLRSLSLLALVLCLAGCAWLGGGNGVTGEQKLVDRDAAIAVAKRASPLRVVDHSDTTRLLPIQHFLLGTDESGRQIAVWVRRGVERYVYLDELKVQTREAALAVAGVPSDQATAVILDYLERDSRPFIWQIVTPGKEIWLNASTGEIVPQK